MEFEKKPKQNNIEGIEYPQGTICCDVTYHVLSHKADRNIQNKYYIATKNKNPNNRNN